MHGGVIKNHTTMSKCIYVGLYCSILIQSYLQKYAQSLSGTRKSIFRCSNYLLEFSALPLLIPLYSPATWLRFVKEKKNDQTVEGYNLIVNWRIQFGLIVCGEVI